MSLLAVCDCCENSQPVDDEDDGEAPDGWLRLSLRGGPRCGVTLTLCSPACATPAMMSKLHDAYERSEDRFTRRQRRRRYFAETSENK
jgi:hypothetical protein